MYQLCCQNCCQIVVLDEGGKDSLFRKQEETFQRWEESTCGKLGGSAAVCCLLSLQILNKHTKLVKQKATSYADSSNTRKHDPLTHCNSSSQ